MRLRDVSVEHGSDGARLLGTIERQNPRSAEEVYIEFAGGNFANIKPQPDAFAAALLIPAMRANEPLEIELPISPRVHLQLPRIRDLFHTWYPDQFAQIDIRTTPSPAEPMGKRSAATFFSGGVDSLYTLLKYCSGGAALPVPLSHVIFMRGVETKLAKSSGVSASEALVRQTAEEVGVKVITGETNFRTVLQGTNFEWERHYMGSALAAIGLALSPLFEIVCIPSGFSYNHLVPHGSSPLLDEMYSSNEVTILHDGAEVDRAEKVGRIVVWNQDLVLRQLRVCLTNRGGATNCGRCRKCVRTLIPLAALNLIEQPKLFAEIDRRRWANAMILDHPVFLIENLKFVERHGASPELISIIKSARRRRKLHEVKLALRNRLGLRPASGRMRT